MFAFGSGVGAGTGVGAGVGAGVAVCGFGVGGLLVVGGFAGSMDVFGGVTGVRGFGFGDDSSFGGEYGIVVISSRAFRNAARFSSSVSGF